MNRYDIEVRPTSNTDFFQYYTETVSAPTTSDAIKKVERMNPGANCTCTDIEYGDGDSDYSDSSSSGFGMGFGGLVVIAGAIGFFALVGNTDSDKNNYQPDNTSVIENIQKSFSDIAPKSHPLQFNIRELPKSTPAQFRAEENGCDIWRNAQPTLAAQLQPGDKCYR